MFDLQHVCSGVLGRTIYPFLKSLFQGTVFLGYSKNLVTDLLVGQVDLLLCKPVSQTTGECLYKKKKKNYLSPLCKTTKPQTKKKKKKKKRNAKSQKVPHAEYTDKTTEQVGTIIIIIMSVFLEHLSMWNMLNCAEQVQIQNACI